MVTLMVLGGFVFSLPSLEILGQKLDPNPAPIFCSGEPPLDNPGLHYEEIIAADGVVEEYFAYDAS